MPAIAMLADVAAVCDTCSSVVSSALRRADPKIVGVGVVHAHPNWDDAPLAPTAAYVMSPTTPSGTGSTWRT